MVNKIGAKYFSCPDGQTIEIEQCYKQCRMEERCMCLPAMRAVGRQRKWYGKPSVTQLIKPTIQAYLDITSEFTINPMNSIASMIGTNSHSLMEGNSPNGWLSEIRFEDDITSGQPDAVDLINRTLYDFKFFGAFRVARALGHRSRWVVDGYYQRDTKANKKGDPKWKEVFEPGGIKDILEIAIQLSYYKLLLKKHGIDINDIKAQIFLRGGLDRMAKNYGLTKTAYTIPIYPISESTVRKYMVMKYDRLMYALDKKELPPVCSKKERWDTSKSYPDRKCRDWCNVNTFCPYYQQNYGVSVPEDIQNYTQGE